MNNTTNNTPPIVVAPGGPISDVDVDVDIRHTFDGDLDIFVVHGGTTVELSTDNGGNGDNYTGTLFDDESAAPVTSGVAPFTGTFKPEGLLTHFDSLDKGGDWVLSVGDDATGDTGTILHWSLHFTNIIEDCNTNGVGDACDVGNESVDCNTNGVPDECDLAGGASQDCNADGTPDDCECGCPGDTNADGFVDGVDIQSFLQCMTGDCPPAGCACADLDGDHNVGLSDLALIIDELLLAPNTACP